MESCMLQIPQLTTDRHGARQTALSGSDATTYVSEGRTFARGAREIRRSRAPTSAPAKAALKDNFEASLMRTVRNSAYKNLRLNLSAVHVLLRQFMADN